MDFDAAGGSGVPSPASSAGTGEYLMRTDRAVQSEIVVIVIEVMTAGTTFPLVL